MAFFVHKVLAYVFAKAIMARNAGGRALDAMRTLAVLQTIGAPGTIVVMHHTSMLCMNHVETRHQ